MHGTLFNLQCMQELTIPSSTMHKTKYLVITTEAILVRLHVVDSSSLDSILF